MATILQFNNVIDDQKKMGEAQYIQIGSVKPRPEDKPEFVYNSGVAPEIKNFYTVNDVSTFQFDRSFHRGEKDPNNEFKTLCTERLVMHTNYTFPGILQWYEVIRTEQLTLSPVCTANEAVKSACKELQKEIDKTKKDSSIDAIKSLSMKLQGMISASVQGGIPKYQEAFFSPDYERLHPEERDRIRELKELLNEQVKLLDHGLHLMKTMDRMHGTGLSDMLRSLGEILRDIKESLGMQSSSVRRSSSHLSVSSVREGNRRSDSGVESMLVEQRPGTPGGGSIQSSGSNRSSGFSAADAVSEELVDLSEPDQGPQENIPPINLPTNQPPKGAYSNNSKKKRPFSMILSTEKKPRVPPKSVWYDSGTVSSSLLEKSISDPDISRQPSHKYPDSFSRDSPFRHPGLSAEPIPEKPEPPPKQRQPKETQELVKSEISATSNRVPPLPPRKPSLGKQTNGLHRTSMYEPVESSQSSDTPPPIPQRASVLRSTVPKPAPRSSVIRHEENSRL